ncbi:hypothetical protein [Salinicoccus sp. Marseille-QA3877]
MTIIVKYSDTKNNKTRYHLISNPGDTEHIKQDYIKKESHSKNIGQKMIEFIYPDHTERFRIYELNYRRHS